MGSANEWGIIESFKKTQLTIRGRMLNAGEDKSKGEERRRRSGIATND